MPTNRNNDEVGKNNSVYTYYGNPVFKNEADGQYVIDNPNFRNILDKIFKGYVIPYNFPLNTRRGFRTIYYLMKLSNHDMTTVIKDIIAVRHAGINFILNICDKLEKENDCMLKI